MLITKYRVTKEDGFIEFKTEQEAIDFCTSNSISEESISDTSEEFADLVLVEGTVIKVIVPDKITASQLRRALVLSETSVEIIDDAISSLSEPDKSLTQIDWEYSTSFKRGEHMASQIGSFLSWSTQQLDDLWILAKSL